MIRYSQRNPSWTNHPLGWGPNLGTIGMYGCYDTVDAMILTDTGHPMNPAQVDEYFTNKQIFVKDTTGTYDLMPQNALGLAFPGEYDETTYWGYRGDIIASVLPTPNMYAVLFISTATVPTHFVIAASVDGAWIIDPWTGEISLLRIYGGSPAIKATKVVTHHLANPPVLPPPSPIPPDPLPIPTIPFDWDAQEERDHQIHGG